MYAGYLKSPDKPNELLFYNMICNLMQCFEQGCKSRPVIFFRKMAVKVMIYFEVVKSVRKGQGSIKSVKLKAPSGSSEY